MATPWVSAHKRLRPVRAKVWANGWLLLLPFQGVGSLFTLPRALPWAWNLLGFQPVLGRHNIRPPHFASKVSYSASPQTSAKCPRGAPCSDAATAMFGKKRNRIWKFRVSKCDFFLGCRGDAGVALFLLFPSEREAERAQEFVARHETVVEREGRFGSVCPEVERVVDFWRRHEVAPFSAYLLLLFVDAF